MSQLTETQNKISTQKNFFNAGAVSALLLLVLFLIGSTSIITASLRITINCWLMPTSRQLARGALQNEQGTSS
jgi:hypothetical protein